MLPLFVSTWNDILCDCTIFNGFFIN